MVTSTLSVATGITGCGAGSTPRVSLTVKGISASPLPSASMRRIFPPAQNTMERLSGVQSMLG